jgi:hypothetical protein
LGNITHIRSSMILSIKTLRIRTNKVTLRIVLTPSPSLRIPWMGHPAVKISLNSTSC